MLRPGENRARIKGFRIGGKIEAKPAEQKANPPRRRNSLPVISTPPWQQRRSQPPLQMSKEGPQQNWPTNTNHTTRP